MRWLKHFVLAYFLIGAALAAWASISAKMFSIDAFMVVTIFWPVILWLMFMFS